jgi:hypothetical protein
MYAFSFNDSIGNRGCQQYRSPRREFSLSDHRSLSTKDFIDLMGDWGAFDSLEAFHPFQDSLMVEGFSKEWSSRFTAESGPIVALEFVLDRDFSDVDSLLGDLFPAGAGGNYMLRRERDFFPSGAETFFRIPMTRVGNGADDDMNGYVDDFAELDNFFFDLGSGHQQSVKIHDPASGKMVFKFGVGIDSFHPIINPLNRYFWPSGDSSDISSFHPLYMHYHPDSGWSYRYKTSLRGGKQGILVAANLSMGPFEKFTEKIRVKLYTVDSSNDEVVLEKPLVYRFDPARYPFGALQPPADPFNGDMQPGEIYLVGKKSLFPDTKEYQLLLWLPTHDLARMFNRGAPISDLKGRRYASIEFETPLPENTPVGEKPNISAYTQYLFLE